MLEKAGKMREDIAGPGFRTTGHGTPIIPVMLSSMDRAKNLSLFLEENRIIVPFMNYPSAQESHMIRIAVTACHTDDQTQSLLDVLSKWTAENGTD